MVHLQILVPRLEHVVLDTKAQVNRVYYESHRLHFPYIVFFYGLADVVDVPVTGLQEILLLLYSSFEQCRILNFAELGQHLLQLGEDLFVGRAGTLLLISGCQEFLPIFELLEECSDFFRLFSMP